MQNHQQAHMMVSTQFVALASAQSLSNHGRFWEVFFNGCSLGFSDSPTSGEAIKDAHKREVNNALYSRTTEALNHLPTMDMPPPEVMAEYPDLVKKFADVFEGSEALAL